MHYKADHGNAHSVQKIPMILNNKIYIWNIAHMNDYHAFIWNQFQQMGLSNIYTL